MNLKYLIRLFIKSQLLGLLFLSFPAHGQSVGNLFTTPEEREYLDLLRQEFLRNNEAANFDVDETAPPPIFIEEEIESDPGVIEFYLGAIMTRSNGARSVWLNDNLLGENQLPENFSLIDFDSGLALLIQVRNNEFILKPGQNVNIDTGILRETSPVLNQPPQPPTTEEDATTLEEPLVVVTVEQDDLPTEVSLSPDETTPDSLLDSNDPEVIQALQVLQEASSEQ